MCVNESVDAVTGMESIGICINIYIYINFSDLYVVIWINIAEFLQTTVEIGPSNASPG